MIANMITGLGLIIAVWFNILLFTGPQNPLFMLIVALAIGLTDFLDGYIARVLSIVSDLGKTLDRLRDKVFILPFLGKEMLALRGSEEFIESAVVGTISIILAAEAGIIILWIKGVLMKGDVGSHISGKIKTTLCTLAVLLMLSHDFYIKNFGGAAASFIFEFAILAVLFLGAVFAIWSFFNYIKRYSEYGG